MPGGIATPAHPVISTRRDSSHPSKCLIHQIPLAVTGQAEVLMNCTEDWDYDMRGIREKMSGRRRSARQGRVRKGRVCEACGVLQEERREGTEEGIRGARYRDSDDEVERVRVEAVETWVEERVEVE